MSSVYLDRPRIGTIVDGGLKPWARSLEILHRPPPNLVLVSKIAPIALWEVFVHHEDVRRPNEIARTWAPDLRPVAEWLLRYNRRRLSTGIRVLADDITLAVGHGDHIDIAGHLPEVVLWLSGRPAAHVRIDASATEADELLHRLRA